MYEVVLTPVCGVIGALAGTLSYRLMMPWSERFMDRLFGRWSR